MSYSVLHGVIQIVDRCTRPVHLENRLDFSLACGVVRYDNRCTNSFPCLRTYHFPCFSENVTDAVVEVPVHRRDVGVAAQREDVGDR